MKSVIQEASSITKAIEKAWEIAGKPKNFSIKIFEEPRRNFFGMVVQSAKVGIFFTNEQQQSAQEQNKRRPQQSSSQHPNRQQQIGQKSHPVEQQRTQQPQRTERPQRTMRPYPHAEQQASTSSQESTAWSPELSQEAHSWLVGALHELGKTQPEVRSSTQGVLLTLSVVGPIAADAETERAVLRSFATLLMQSLRHKLGKPLRGLKLSLKSNEH